MAEIEEGQFLEIEKRFAAFKHVFNTLQTSVHKPLKDEFFETSHQIYLGDLLNGNIKFSNVGNTAQVDDNVQPGSHCGWQVGTVGSNDHERVLFGNKYTLDPTDPNYPIFSTNPNVEKVIVPLYKLGDTNRQAYFTFQPPESAAPDETGDIDPEGDENPDTDRDVSGVDGTYQYTTARDLIINNPERRIRNWIAPSKFGKDYKVRIFESNEDYTGPDMSPGGTRGLELPLTEQNTLTQAGLLGNNIIHGGYIFDYYQGMMYLAPHKDHNDPDGNQFPYIPGYRHPLWLVGYRYNGPTGSNMTVAGAESAGTADSSGGGGGVSTTLFSQPAGAPLAYDVNTYGWYDINTQTATDTEDIIEYRTDDFIVISGSLGEQDLIVRLDSSSYNNITSTPWGLYSNEDEEVYNGGNLFAFAGESFADYSSYALFRTTGSNGYDPNWITQSFQFNTPIRLHQIGLCFSNDTSVDISTDLNSPANGGNAIATVYRYPAAYKLEGSVTADGPFNEVASVTNLRNTTIAGNVPGPIGGPTLNKFGSATNNEYWPNNGEYQAAGDKYIYCATGSINDATRYQYYRLYVSGGVKLGTDEDLQYEMALHHVDLWQNLDFGPTNRKQINVKFNDRGSGQLTPFSEELTVAEKFVSASMAKIGFSHFTPAGIQAFTEGSIFGDLTFPNVSHLQGLGQITASIISASTSITTGNLTAVSMSGNGDGITFNSAVIEGETTVQDLIVQNQLNLQSGVTLPSDAPLFLTNKKQDGSLGTDEFSARIFGNFVEDGGVSDMYLDAYRIYTVSDAKMHIRTLHPSLGSIVLQTIKTHVSASSLLVDGAITASSGMSLSGSLLISGSIIPNVGPGTLTSSFDLGSSTAAWHDIHVSNGTIRLYDGAQEKAQIRLNSDDQIEFKSELDEFRGIKAGTLDLTPVGSAISTVQISNDASNGAGFIAVHDRHGKNSTIFRGEGTVTGGERMGSITQKGTGSFAILLDADGFFTPRSNAKFVVESNSTIPGNFLSQRLFSVSESFETRVHDGGLRADKYVTTTNITASIISASATITANSFTGVFNGSLSSSKQIATEISGAFYQSSHSLQSRVSNIEFDTSGKTLISSSAQIANTISGSFIASSASFSSRATTLETFNQAFDTNVTDTFNEFHGPFSSSITSRVQVLESNGVFTANAISGAFDQTSGSIQSRLTTISSNLQPVLSATSSYAVINNDVLFKNITASNNISASNIDVNIISSSHFHTEIFNPANISTTELTASLSNLGTITNTRTFTTDDYNILFAASTRPALTVRNAGGGDITYFGSPVDNADAFIKFQADRSSTTFAMGIDSHDGTFKIAEGTYLNENSGFAPFSIKNNKVAILQSNDPAYPLDVAGDIRSTGTMRVDTIKGQTYPYTSIVLESNVTTSLSISASGTITANAFVGDGTGLSGIATVGSVVLNSATASFVTTTTAIDGGTF